MKKKQLVLGIFVDFLCLAIVYSFWVSFTVIGVPPTKRGFFCNDESIHYPYRPNTFPDYSMYIFAVLVAASIPPLELLFDFLHHQSSEERFKPSLFSKSYLLRSYNHVIAFAQGLGITLVIVLLGQTAFGRLRPMFLERCIPDYSKFNCTNERGEYVYVEEPFCQETDSLTLRQIRMSFPSGHSAMTFFGMFYMCIYLESKRFPAYLSRLKTTFQCIAVTAALYCGASRIFDNAHHVEDVIGGATIAIIIAFTSAYSMTDMFQDIIKRHHMRSSLSHQKVTEKLEYEYIADNTGFELDNSGEKSPLLHKNGKDKEENDIHL